jgi:acetyltransferase-like isoleucine patch superfamily enzyme
LGHKVCLFTSSDDFSGQTMTSPTVPPSFKAVKAGPIHLGRHVIVGVGGVIMPDVTIAEGCAIGALSFVNRSLEAWGIYVGIPVRRISRRRQDLLRLERKLIENRPRRIRLPSRRDTQAR